MARQLSSRALALASAVCAGITLMGVYIAQPLVTLISAELGVSTAAAETVITSSLVGYAFGLLFLVPLADRFNVRILVRIFATLGTVALLVGAVADNLAVVIVGTLVAALFGIIPQLLVPLVVSQSQEGNRALNMSIVLTGLTCGTTLSRPVFGLIGDHAGWRTAYVTEAVATLIVGWVVSLLLPDTTRDSSISYPGLFRSIWRYVRTSPQLRNACLRNAMNFAAFNAFWATLTPLLTASPFNLTVGQASLVGLLGLASAFLSPLAGTLTDRHGSRLTCAIGLACMAVALVMFWAGQSVLWMVLFGVLLVPIALQYNQVPLQNIALAVDRMASGRLNTVFMFTSFIGGAIGSQIAGVMIVPLGWGAVCTEATVFFVIAVVLFFVRPGGEGSA